MTLCTFAGCNRAHRGKGYCAPHLKQFHSGKPLRPVRERKGRGDPTELCAFLGCDRPASGYAATLYVCDSHKSQFRLTGSLRPKRDNDCPHYQRWCLTTRYEVVGDCWIWTGGKSAEGYGRVCGKRPAHRLAFELFVRPLAEGEIVHHTCHNRACINPAHLQSATVQQNNLEMMERRSLLARIAFLEAENAELRSVAPYRSIVLY